MKHSGSKVTDAIGRRKRDRRTSTGKRVTLQERDLLWLQKIHRHGPLSSSYLHAFSKHLRCNEKRARDRLTDLYNEDHTPHGGPYLERPWQQFQTYDARYQELVYDLAPAGKKALKQNERWSNYAQVHAGPWVHRFMVSSITASIELATLDDPGLEYIPQEEILKRADTALRYPVPFTNPKTNRTETRDLIPDAIFGLEYKRPSGSKFRFFLLEADRATEPTKTSNFNRKSHLRNFLQYREYVGRGLYKEHLKLTAGILVLNVTSSEKTMKRMLDLVSELSKDGNSYLLFQVCKQFKGMFSVPDTKLLLLTGSFERAGLDRFQIFT